MFLYTYAVKLNALITKCVISERGLIWGEQFSGFRCFIRMKMFFFQTSLFKPPFCVCFLLWPGK